jgi:hypothetical protein
LPQIIHEENAEKQRGGKRKRPEQFNSELRMTESALPLFFSHIFKQGTLSIPGYF